MKLSKKGLDLICSFEGYLIKTKDGGCRAYRCPAKVWTCGWGCTEGVGPNTVWTKEEAEEKFKTELAKFEKAVDRLVKVKINQNQYDALVSFSYNCGEGALKKSTLLKKLNKGDYAGACAQFAAWNKGGGRVLRGLTRRRAAEAALFSTRMPHDDDKDEIPTEGMMAQKVDKPLHPAVKPALAVGATAGAVEGVNQVAPSVSEAAKSINWDAVVSARTYADGAGDMFSWATASPLLALLGGTILAGFIFGPVLYPLVKPLISKES